MFPVTGDQNISYSDHHWNNVMLPAYHYFNALRVVPSGNRRGPRSFMKRRVMKLEFWSPLCWNPKWMIKIVSWPSKLFWNPPLEDETMFECKVLSWHNIKLYLYMFHLESVGHVLRHRPIGFMQVYWFYGKTEKKCQKSRFLWKKWVFTISGGG